MGKEGEIGNIGPQGAQDSQGPTGKEGAPGLAGLKGDGLGLRGPVVVSEIFSGAGSEKFISVQCPVNMVVIDGGYSVAREDIRILASSPLESGDGWRVRAVGPAVFWNLTTYATCATKYDCV